MVTILLAFSAALGLVIGSFCNVVIYRLPRRESLAVPGSHCPACGKPVRWYHNIPVAGWLVLMGRCADCRAPISPRYPAVEAATGALFLACALSFGLTWATPAAWLFCSMCLCLALIDLEHQILPDRLTYPGVVLGLGLSLVMPWTKPLDSAIGAAAGAALPAALIGIYALRGIEAMGWGDVKFMAMIGAFLGWRGAILTLVGGSVLGIVIGGTWLLFSRKSRRTPLPFGTFLGAAAVCALFFGEKAWASYLNLFPWGGR